MNLKQKIIEDFKVAFKKRDVARKNTLSMLKSEISNREIELGIKEEGLGDEEVVAAASKLVKQRKDAANQFRSGGREDLALKEESEAQILMSYLPKQISEQEIEEEVRKIAGQIGSAGKKDMGKLMGASMAKLKGKADGLKVKEIVEKILS